LKSSMIDYINDKALVNKGKVKKTLIRFRKHEIVIDGKVKIFITASNHSGSIQSSKMKLEHDEEVARISLLFYDMKSKIDF
jgi:hypothetical protein